MAGTVLRTLPNGLRLIVREQHSTALVAIDIWVRAGSGREEASESGAAHFLEHLLFKGTPTRKPGEIDAAIEDLGATLNAGTLRDGAHFYTTVATSGFDTALEVLSDALQNSIFAPEEVEHERTVILDEMARGLNDHRKQTLNRLYESIYRKFPYRRPILGLPDSLKNLSRDTIVGFYHRLYAPSNTTVVLVGDLTPDAAEAAVTKAFGHWPKRDVPPPPVFDEKDPESKDPSTLGGTTSPPAPTSPIASPQDKEQTAKMSKMSIAVGFRVTASDNTTEVCASDVLAELLTGDGEGRIQAALESHSLRAEIAAEDTTLRAPSIFALYAETAPAHVEEIRKTFLEELDRVRRDPVPENELDTARRRVIGAYLFDIETYAGQARMLGSYDVSNDYRFAMDYVDNIRKVTARDIQAFAQRYFDPSLRVEVRFP